MYMHEDIKEIMFTKQEIDMMVHDIAARINNDFDDDELVAVIILKGSVIFASDLIRCLTMNVKLEFMQASSYGDGTKTTGVIKIKKDIDMDIAGKNVLIIEDIIDSGRTLSLLKEEMKKRGAKEVRIASLLSKPARRVASTSEP